MLSLQTVQLLATGGVIGVVIASIPTFAYLCKKDINTGEKLSTVEKALNAVEPALTVAKEIVPLNPVVNIADYIEKWTKIGVEKAQQLYHSSQLTNNEDRKQAAIDTVTTALKELNITPTDNQMNLINDIIEASVYGLGHKDQTEVEKEAEKQALQAQLAQVTAERDNLKNTMATITATASDANSVQTAQ